MYRCRGNYSRLKNHSKIHSEVGVPGLTSWSPEQSHYTDYTVGIPYLQRNVRRHFFKYILDLSRKWRWNVLRGEGGQLYRVLFHKVMAFFNPSLVVFLSCRLNHLLPSAVTLSGAGFLTESFSVSFSSNSNVSTFSDLLRLHLQLGIHGTPIG